jgi:hypothetical protein
MEFVDLLCLSVVIDISPLAILYPDLGWVSLVAMQRSTVQSRIDNLIIFDWLGSGDILPYST